MNTIDISRAFRDYAISTEVRDLHYQGLYFNSKRLVNSNTKLHNILIFDLPAVKTCLNCDDCKDRCYAMKAQIQYVDTRIFRDTNLFMYLHDKDMLRDLIVSQLSESKQTVVRLHSSGDFFSQDYIEFWDEIISIFPKIKFYAYTKVKMILDFGSIEKNKNFNLIESLIDGKLNFGSIEYCKELKKEYKAFICPVTNGYDNLGCGKGCTYCVTKKNVCFVEH